MVAEGLVVNKRKRKHLATRERDSQFYHKQ